MEIDSKGIIWLEGRGHPDIYGYSSGCVASYDGETWKVHDASNSVFSEEWLFSLFISDDGEVWTGNRSGKVYRKMESGWKEYDPSVIKYDDNLYVQSIVFDHENHPFIVNQPASGEGGTIIKCSVNTGKAIMDLERGEKYAIISDGNDGIFLRGRNKVRHYTGSNWLELPDPPHTWWLDPHERLIELDGENRLWIDSYSVTPDENLDPVTHFGVAFLENGTWTRYSYENSILEDVSTAYLCMDIHGDPWIASNNELFHYDGYFWNSMDAGEAYYALPAQARKRIVADKDNTIWVPGNSYGILSFDGLTSTWYPHPDLNQYAMGVNDIAADSEGTVWMTSGFYLLGFDGSNWTTFHWENSPLPYFMNLTAMGIDRYDNIWLATSIWIFKYHKGGIVSDTSKIPSEKDITILPNPVQDVAEILLDRYYDNISIHLVDMFGRVLGTTQHMRTDRIMVPCSHLGSGMYMIKLVSNDREIWTGQMIKL